MTPVIYMNEVSLLKGTQLTHSIVAIQVNCFQTELTVKIYSKILDTVIGKVLLMKFS